MQIEFTKCPYCKEDIQTNAIKCKFCGEFLNSNHSQDSYNHAMKPCPFCCEEIPSNAFICKHCNSALINQSDTIYSGQDYYENNSGLRDATIIPDNIKGWNWGAFGFTWIWGIANSSYLTLFALIPYFNLIWAIICGLKGNEWAWKNKRWQNAEHFHKIQKKWAYWTLCLTILSLLVASGVLMFLSMNSNNKTSNPGLNDSFTGESLENIDSNNYNEKIDNSELDNEDYSQLDSKPTITKVKHEKVAKKIQQNTFIPKDKIISSKLNTVILEEIPTQLQSGYLNSSQYFYKTSQNPQKLQKGVFFADVDTLGTHKFQKTITYITDLTNHPLKKQECYGNKCNITTNVSKFKDDIFITKVHQKSMQNGSGTIYTVELNNGNRVVYTIGEETQEANNGYNIYNVQRRSTYDSQGNLLDERVFSADLVNSYPRNTSNEYSRQ